MIIPVYNEESTIAEVLDRVHAVDLDKEIIVVDDGSTDATLELVRPKRAVLKHVHESRVNLGKGLAVRIGLTYAEGDIVIIQDADLELDPAEYGQLLAPILRGETNVVYGSRFKRPSGERPPRGRVLANRVLTGLTNLLYGTSLTDMATAYKVMRTDVLRRIRLDARGFEFEPEVTAKLTRLGERIIEVPVSYRPRSVAEGKKIGWLDGLRYIWCLVRWRSAPMSRLLRAHRRSAPTEAQDAQEEARDDDLGTERKSAHGDRRDP